MMSEILRQFNVDPEILGSNTEYIIFVGLDMGPIELARREDTRHTIVMASILLLIGFAGIVSLVLGILLFTQTRGTLAVVVLLVVKLVGGTGGDQTELMTKR